MGNNAINRATVTLLKGSWQIATTKVATIPTGSSRVVFKLRTKLKQGTYAVKLTGTSSNGGAFSTTGRTRV